MSAVTSSANSSARSGKRPYELTTELWLPQPPEQVFPFFADAYNLERITPSFLRFRVITPKPIDMHAGTIIDYRLKVHGLPLRWRTRISLWEPPYRFRDEALKSPYRQWIHTHTFEPRDGGTLCLDHVQYDVTGGNLVHRLFVRRDVEKIFAFRAEQLKAIFPLQVAVQPDSASLTDGKTHGQVAV